MKAKDHVAPKMARQVRIVGICWVIYGVARLFAAVWLVSFSNTVTGVRDSRVPDSEIKQSGIVTALRFAG